MRDVARSHPFRFIGLFFCFLAFSSASAWAEGLEGWAKLRVEGRKFLIAKGRAEIERWPARVADEPNAKKPGSELVAVLSSAQIFGKSSAEHRAFSPGADADAVSRWMEFSHGKRGRVGVWKPGQSYQVTKYKPVANSDPSRMTDWKSSDVKNWTDVPDQRPVDPYRLLGELDRLVGRRSGTLRVLTKAGVGTLEFRTSQPETRKWTVRDLDSGTKRRLNLRVARVELFAAEGEETVLSLSGPTELWVDVDSGALIQISGRSAKGGGQITLRLTGVSHRSSPKPDLHWPR